MPRLAIQHFRAVVTSSAALPGGSQATARARIEKDLSSIVEAVRSTALQRFGRRIGKQPGHVIIVHPFRIDHFQPAPRTGAGGDAEILIRKWPARPWRMAGDLRPLDFRYGMSRLSMVSAL